MVLSRTTASTSTTGCGIMGLTTVACSFSPRQATQHRIMVEKWQERIDSPQMPVLV